MSFMEKYSPLELILVLIILVGGYILTQAIIKGTSIGRELTTIAHIAYYIVSIGLGGIIGREMFSKEKSK